MNVDGASSCILTFPSALCVNCIEVHEVEYRLQNTENGNSMLHKYLCCWQILRGPFVMYHV